MTLKELVEIHPDYVLRADIGQGDQSAIFEFPASAVIETEPLTIDGTSKWKLIVSDDK